jgi:hypothetical protein
MELEMEPEKEFKTELKMEYHQENSFSKFVSELVISQRKMAG